jgi:hypothetical protein
MPLHRHTRPCGIAIGANTHFRWYPTPTAGWHLGADDESHQLTQPLQVHIGSKGALIVVAV